MHLHVTFHRNRFHRTTDNDFFHAEKIQYYFLFCTFFAMLYVRQFILKQYYLSKVDDIAIKYIIEIPNKN